MCYFNFIILVIYLNLITKILIIILLSFCNIPTYINVLIAFTCKVCIHQLSIPHKIVHKGIVNITNNLLLQKKLQTL
jgi:hypothetical protein